MCRGQWANSGQKNTKKDPQTLTLWRADIKNRVSRADEYSAGPPEAGDPLSRPLAPPTRDRQPPWESGPGACSVASPSHHSRPSKAPPELPAGLCQCPVTGEGQEPWLESALATPIMGHLSPSREGIRHLQGPGRSFLAGDEWLPGRLVPHHHVW